MPWNYRPVVAVDRLRPKSILVIDDCDVDREILVDTLTLAGFTVHGTASPIGATRRARQLQVGLVVIDQNLPSIDGSKLPALFRTAGLDQVRIILVSSSDEQTMLELQRQVGADAFVSKSRLNEDLVATARRLLAK